MFCLHSPRHLWKLFDLYLNLKSTLELTLFTCWPFSKPSLTLKRILNMKWFKAITLSTEVFFFLIVYSDCGTPVCQRTAVLLWPLHWSPTPPIWESCCWLTMRCRIQEWSSFVIFWRVQAADWILLSQFKERLLCSLFFDIGCYIFYPASYQV